MDSFSLLSGKSNIPFADSSLHFPEVSGQAVSHRKTDNYGCSEGGEAAIQALPTINSYKALSF